MKILDKIKNLIRLLLDNIHKKRKVVLALSCIVVFVTTYVLILPAFTLDEKEAAEQGGIDLPKAAVQTVVDEPETEAEAATETPVEVQAPVEDENNDSESVETVESEETVDTEETVESEETVEAEEDPDEQPAEDVSEPEDTEPEDLEKPRTEKDFEIVVNGSTYRVAVTYDESAQIPEGAELRVSEITEEDDAYDAFRNNLADTMTETAESITAQPILLDISIWADGQKIEPAEGSDVKVEIKLVKNAIEGTYTSLDSPVLVNEEPLTDKTSNIEQDLQVIHQMEDGNLEVMETENKIAKDGMTSEFTTDSFSDWLLFLDEDLTSITVHEGDTLTLRPYTEWVWKQSDMQGTEYAGGEWIFPNNAWSQSSSSEWVPTINSTVYFTDYTTIGAGTGENKFHVFSKEDSQLEETYNVCRSDPLKPGEFDIQTNKGKVIHVKVLPGTSSAKPGTVEGITGIPGLKVNLFDYDVPSGQYGQGYDFTKSGSLDVQSNTANNGHNGLGGQGINSGHDLKFLGYGGSNYPDNGRDREWFAINDYTKSKPRQGIVDTMLEQEGEYKGYPKLGLSTNGRQRSNPHLKYLFDPTSKNHNVYAFPEADGLFQKDNQGYYYYNSNVNYAEYNRSTNQFVLYEHTYSQDTSGSGGANAKPIGFFPFHEYDTHNTQPGMNFNQDLNHHFGMTMEVDFELPEDKRAADDDGYKHDIIYEFSGDDDLWVFVDDELVMDIGGIHQPVTGSINFTTGVIHIHGVDQDKVVNFEVGSHTLKMFYIERGGCDSNLSVKFNLPLILGKGDISLHKKSQKTDSDNRDTSLVGAVFGIWDNPECEGEPYSIATSDNNGIIFKNLPIRATDQVYYLQEITPPEGYKIDKTIYKLSAVKESDGSYSYVVTKDGEPITDIDPVSHYPVIRNTLADNIDVSIQKEWENVDGEPITPSVDTATFIVKRLRSYSADHSDLVDVRLIGYTRENNRIVVNEDEIYDHVYAEVGDELTIKYRHSPQPTDAGELMARLGNRYERVGWLTVNGQGTDQTFDYTVQSAHQLNGTVDLLVPISFADWCNGYNYANGDNPHFTGYGAHEHTMITEVDPSYQDTIVVRASTGWKGTLQNLPVFHKDSSTGISYYYEYFVSEDNIPEGFEAVYYENGVPIAGNTSPAINDTDELKVVNRELIDVPLEKEWADFGGENYTWTVTFQLEEMEVKVNEADPDASDALTDFEPIDGKTLTVTKDQNPAPTFKNLPKYRVHSNGTIYRIIYSVSETSYKVTRISDNVTIAQWSEDGSMEFIGDKRYAPIFVQDAGENGSENEEYTIILVNEPEHRKLFNSIDLTVQKTWPQGSTYESSDDTFARFALRRYVHQEFRDYSGYEGEWVTILLDTGLHSAGEDHIFETITVPVNTELHITGKIKPNTNANRIEFTRSSGEPNLTLIQNNQESTPQEFSISFRATQDQTIELLRGDNYVVGGRDGFRLTDTYIGGTPDVKDNSFEEIFTLNKANGWQKSFNYLPQIEETDVDPATGSQTIYVYSYYLEEIASNPADFSAVFSSNIGVTGTENDRIDEDAELTAENIQKTVDFLLRKVAKKDLEVANPPTLKGAAFTIEKYKASDYQNLDTDWGDNGSKSLEDINNNGEFSFTDLTTGYYKIVETEFPEGYVRLSEYPIFKVEMDSNGDLVFILLNEDGDPADDNKTEMVRIDSTTAVATIVVGNEPGVELPYTGGIGTTIFYVLGSILVLVGGVYLAARRRIMDR